MSVGVMWIQLDLVFQSFPALISSFPNGNIHNPVDPVGRSRVGEAQGKVGEDWKEVENKDE